MLQAKQFYLDQLKDGPLSHRKIMNRMAGRFTESSVAVRDALISEGMIQVEAYMNIGKSKKRDYIYKLTGKQTVTDNSIEFWDEGHVKSKGNAFDWNNGKISLFTKQDIANARNQGRPANYNPFPITTFSRA